jgi:hypothetical protein
MTTEWAPSTILVVCVGDLRLGIVWQSRHDAELGISQERLDSLDHALTLADLDGLTDFKGLFIRQMPGRHSLIAAA